MQTNTIKPLLTMLKLSADIEQIILITQFDVFKLWKKNCFITQWAVKNKKERKEGPKNHPRPVCSKLLIGQTCKIFKYQQNHIFQKKYQKNYL